MLICKENENSYVVGTGKSIVFDRVVMVLLVGEIASAC